MFPSYGSRAGRMRVPVFTIQYWTETLSNLTPNNVRNTVAWTVKPISGVPNIDAAIVLQGTGGFLNRVPDGTIVGGNKPNAINYIDWQFLRNNADQIADGDYSVLIGGNYNKIDPATSGNGRNFIGGGTSNRAGANDSAIVGGRNNVVNGVSAFIGGGQGCHATGANSVAFGSGASATGDTSYACGSTVVADAQYSHSHGSYATNRGTVGVWAWSAGTVGINAINGDGQHRKVQLRQRIAFTATATELTSDNSAASTTNQLNLTTSTAITVARGVILALREGTVQHAVWDVDIYAVRVSGSASVITSTAVLRAGNTFTTGAVTFGTTAPDVVWIKASNGSATPIVRWFCHLDTYEIGE